MMKASFVNVSAILQKQNKILPKIEFLLRFDGCSKGNPGKAAAGAVIYQNETALTEHEYLEILNSRSLSKVSGSLLIQEAIFN